MRYLPSLLALALFSASLPAQEAAPTPPPLPEQEEVPTPVPPQQDEELEGEVTIIRRGEDVIEEYRVNGQLYKVKITPKYGPPYYLEDTDGDGSLDSRRNELDDPEVVKWRIFSW